MTICSGGHSLQRKCAFTVYSCAGRHHILSLLVQSGSEELTRAQPSGGFEVKSSREETQLTLPYNQHRREI